MRRITNLTDLVSGLFLVGTALFALAVLWPLKVGTALRMGPGYLPRALCFLQIALGCLVVAQSLLGPGTTWERWVPRPIVWVFAGVAFFGVAIERFGLVVAVLGLVLLSSLASANRRWFEPILLAIGLALFAVLVFVEALGLGIPVWPNAGS